MRFCINTHVHFAPLTTDKIAWLVKLRNNEYNRLYQICQSQGISCCSGAHHTTGSVFNIGTSYDYVTKSLPLYTKGEDRAFSYFEKDEKRIQSHVTSINLINKLLISLSNAEIDERQQLIDQQTFSTAFLDGKEAAWFGSLVDCDNMQPVYHNNDKDVKSIFECDNAGLITAIKWIQAMLQLEGDDRFNTYQERLSFNSSKMDPRKRVIFCNASLSVVVIGYIQYNEDGVTVLYQDIDSVIYRSATAVELFPIGNIVRMGSTAAATAIRT